ncbi:MAG TPA: hypothetical protein VM008_22140 [Phycisphaerae bacterium]|nr:hypothetical protein [Phycisphaerae bacterium]
MLSPISIRLSSTALRSAATLAALGLAATHAGALTINQWTGNINSSYNNAGNWLNGNVPNSTDQATIYNGVSILNANSPTAGGMLVSKIGTAGQFFTNNYKFTSSGTVDLESGGQLYVQYIPGGALAFQTATLIANGGSLIDMQYSNSNASVTGNVSVDALSNLTAEGLLTVGGTYTNNGLLYNNGGTITAGTFTLSGASNASMATINVNGQALTINAHNFSLSSTYTTIDASAYASHLTLNNTGSNATLVNANVTLGDSAHLSMPDSNAWIFGNIFIGITSGSFNMNGGSTAAHAAVVDQYAYYESLVNVSGYASMASGEFDGGSVVTIAANGTLSVGSPYFRGTTHNGFSGTDTYTTINLNGSGAMNWSGNTGIGYSNVNVPYTAVNANLSTLNWEGTSGANATLDIQNGELNVYSTTIQSRYIYNGISFVSTNGYDGNMTVEGGAKLNVANAAWTLFGSLTLGPGALVQGQTLTLSGGSLPLGTYSLYPSNNGGANPDIQAPLVVGANSTIYMGFTGGLQLDGPTTWAGGAVISAPYVVSPYGTLIQNGNATVTSNTTLFCNTCDMDGSSNTATWTINSGVTFTQQAWYINPGDLTGNAFHSTINLSGTLDMETHSGQWTLAGGTLNMTGTGSAIVQHDKLILGLGSTIGTINVTSGATGFIFGGIESAATSVPGGNIINNNGGLVVQSYFTIDSNAVLTKTGTFDLEVEVGTPSFGVGSVFNVNNGNVNMQFGIPGAPNLTVNVQGPGLIGFFDASNLKTLHILAGGSAVISSGGHHTMFTDNLTIDGGATPTGSFGITDNKVIVEAAVSHNTVFTTLQAQALYGATHVYFAGIYDAYLPANYGVAVMDNAVLAKSTFGGISVDANSILISRELLGDANADGHVDLTDLSKVLNNFGVATLNWTDGNFDGQPTIDLTDLSDVLNNFGLSNPNAFNAPAPATAEAPEPASLALAALAAPLLLKRRPVRGNR